MNPRKRLLFFPLFAILNMVAMIAGQILFFRMIKQQALWMLACLFLYSVAMVFFILVPLFRFSRRYAAAKKAGQILCSKCEYTLDPSAITPCPECGCIRTPEEHAAKWKDWKVWRS